MAQAAYDAAYRRLAGFDPLAVDPILAPMIRDAIAKRGWTPAQWRAMGTADQVDVLAHDLWTARVVGETIESIRERLRQQESLYVDTALLLEIMRLLMTR